MVHRLQNKMTPDLWRRLICGAFLGGTVGFAALVPAPAAAAEDRGPQAWEVEDPRISESSGLASSLRSGHRFWTHNDSGDPARLFAIEGTRDAAGGRVSATVRLSGVEAIDWEDMASGILDGVPTLVVADVGDNARRRSHVTLYLIDEPAPHEPAPHERAAQVRRRGGAEELRETAVRVRRRIDVRYPDGPRDCEAVAIDAAGRRLILLSKELLPAAGIYSVPLPLAHDAASASGRAPIDTEPAGPGGAVVAAERVGTVPLPMATAMDIRGDGQQLAVAGYLDLFLFDRAADESWEAAFKRLPTHIALPKLKQIEAVCYDQRGDLWVSSEGRPMPMLRVSVGSGAEPGEERER